MIEETNGALSGSKNVGAPPSAAELAVPKPSLQYNATRASGLQELALMLAAPSTLAGTRCFPPHDCSPGNVRAEPADIAPAVLLRIGFVMRQSMRRSMRCRPSLALLVGTTAEQRTRNGCKGALMPR